MIVAKLAVVLWVAVFVIALGLWAVVGVICLGVRKLNQLEAMRHAQNPSDPWPELETGDWPDDG